MHCQKTLEGNIMQMKNLLLLAILLVVTAGCASTRYIRLDVIDGTASYSAITQSVNVQSGTIRFYKAVSDNPNLECPEGFFDERKLP
jgi:hypothetical protein